MTFSAGAFRVPDFCLIFAPLKGYDEPEILPSQLSQFGPISADRRTVTAIRTGKTPSGIREVILANEGIFRSLFTPPKPT